MFRLVIISFIILSSILLLVISDNLTNCQTPDNLPGLCVFEEGCLPIMKIKNNKSRSNADTLFYSRSYCGRFETRVKVCCDPKRTSGCPQILEPTVSLECHYGGQQILCSEFMVFDTLVYPTCLEHFEPYKQNALNPLRCVNGSWNQPLPKCVSTCLNGWDCNAYLNFGIQRHRVNKEKLSYYSMLLKNAFKSNATEVVIENTYNINWKIIEYVLDFLHTGINHNWKSDQYSDVLSLSKSLESKYLEDYCIKSFRNHLNEQNYVKLLRTFNETKDEILIKEVIDYIAKTFQDVSIGIDWLELNATTISATLQSKKLIANSEIDVFEGLQRWIKHDRSKRQPHFENFIKYIRLYELSPEFLVKNVSSMCEKNNHCYDLVLAAINQKLPKDPPIFVLKVSSTSITIQKSNWSTEIYFNDVQVKSTIPVLCNRKIYLIGGSTDEFDITDEVWSLDVSKNQSTILSSLKNKRDTTAQVVCNNGMIYISGGFDGEKKLNTIERYDPVANDWTVVAKMPTERENHKAIVYKDKIYLIGGRSNKESLNSVDIYDLELDEWTSGPAMITRCHNFAAEIYGKQLFVFGGYTESGYTKRSVELFDFETQKWTKISDVPVKLTNIIAYVKDNKIIIYGFYWAGGGYWTKYDLKMYEFDPKSYKWEDIDRPWKYVYFIMSGKQMCDYDSRDRNTNFNELCY